MKRRRGLRWAAAGVLVAVGLYFVLDIVMLRYLESRGRDQIVQTMSAEDGSLDLGNVPFLTSFLRGRLDTAEVRIRGANAPGGLRVQTVTAKLNDVRFSPWRMFALARSSFAPRSKITSSSPFGSIELSENDLEDYIQGKVPGIGSVDVKGSGIEVFFLTEGVTLAEDDESEEEKLSQPARYLPRVENGRLLLVPTSLSQIHESFRSEAGRIRNLIELPRFPEGLRSDVRLGEGLVIVEVNGPDVELTLGEGNE
jgi:hypothetical protein